MAEKNEEQKNGNIITKQRIMYRIEECKFVVYLWNCGIKECETTFY